MQLAINILHIIVSYIVIMALLHAAMPIWILLPVLIQLEEKLLIYTPINHGCLVPFIWTLGKFQVFVASSQISLGITSGR